MSREVYSEDKCSITGNVLQLNADFVLHKICDLGAVIRSVCVGRIDEIINLNKYTNDNN